jgi:hypothetical protein
LDLLYSITLLVALFAGALSLLAGIVALVRARRPVQGESKSSPSPRIYRVATTGALVSVVFAVVSIAVHLAFGHRPGSVEGLDLPAFFALHPSYLGVFAMAAGAGLLAHFAKSEPKSR